MIHLLLLFLIQSSAKATSLTQATASWNQTSDDLELHQISAEYRSERADLFWPYADEKPSFYYLGANIEYDQGVNPHEPYLGEHTSFVFGKKESPDLLWQSAFGLEVLHSRPDQGFGSALFADGMVQWIPFVNFNTSFELKHSYLYADLIQTGAVDERLQGTSARFTIQKRLQDFRVGFISNGALYSDQNRRLSVDLSVWYKIEETVNWIWIGLGGENLDYKMKNTSYWSPNHFWSFGPRFEAVMPFYEHWQIATGINLNRFQENGYDPGNGFYANFRIQRGGREEKHYSFGYTRINSQQNDHLWYENSLSLELNYPI